MGKRVRKKGREGEGWIDQRREGRMEGRKQRKKEWKDRTKEG